MIYMVDFDNLRVFYFILILKVFVSILSVFIKTNVNTLFFIARGVISLHLYRTNFAGPLGVYYDRSRLHSQIWH